MGSKAIYLELNEMKLLTSSDNGSYEAQQFVVKVYGNYFDWI